MVRKLAFLESPTSLFDTGGAIVDLTPVVDGTDELILKYSITGGTQALNPGLTGSTLIVTHAIAPDDGVGGYTLVPTSVTVTPEPSCLLLVLTGAPAGIALRRRSSGRTLCKPDYGSGPL